MLRIVVIAGLAAVTAQTAMAQESNVSRQQVSFSERELKDPARTEVAYQRLYRVTQAVCQSDGEGPDWRKSDDLACEDEAMTAALADLRSPELNRRHRDGARAANMASAEVVRGQR